MNSLNSIGQFYGGELPPNEMQNYTEIVEQGNNSEKKSGKNICYTLVKKYFPGGKKIDNLCILIFSRNNIVQGCMGRDLNLGPSRLLPTYLTT